MLAFIFLSNTSNSISQNVHNIRNQDSLLTIIQSTESNELKAKAHFRLYNLNRKLNPQKALSHLFKHLKIEQTIGNIKNIAVAYTQIGWCYITEVQELDSAKIYLDKALQLAFEINDSVRIGSSYTFLGLMYQRKGYYRNAMENYFKSLNYKIPLNNPNRLGFSYNLIGKTYELQNHYEEKFRVPFKSFKRTKERRRNKSCCSFLPKYWRFIL